MTELETLARAKMYMEKLANGINPIDGSIVPDEDIINNVRLSRCFFYVADVLRQVIDNGGISPKKHPHKIPFSLSAEKRAAFEFSSVAIPVTEISKRINALLTDENMTLLPYRAITDWLVSIDALENIISERDKHVRRPTQQGESLGIRLDPRSGINGPYFVVVYELTAQQFILDNLDAIVSHKASKNENQGKPWTAEQDACLDALYKNGSSVQEISFALKRNSGAIRARLKKRGLIKDE